MAPHGDRTQDTLGGPALGWTVPPLPRAMTGEKAPGAALGGSVTAPRPLGGQRGAGGSPRDGGAAVPVATATPRCRPVCHRRVVMAVAGSHARARARRHQHLRPSPVHGGPGAPRQLAPHCPKAWGRLPGRSTGRTGLALGMGTRRWNLRLPSARSSAFPTVLGHSETPHELKHRVPKTPCSQSNMSTKIPCS